MSVSITTQNTLEPTRVPGDFVEIINNLNLASAKGLDFVVFSDHDDNKLAVRLDSITVVQEYEDVSFIG